MSGRSDGDERDIESEQLVLATTVLAKRSGIACPMCPSCGGPPDLGAGSNTWPLQAMCVADDCEVLMWLPLSPALEQLKSAQHAELDTWSSYSREPGESGQQGPAGE